MSNQIFIIRDTKRQKWLETTRERYILSRSGALVYTIADDFEHEHDGRNRNRSGGPEGGPVSELDKMTWETLRSWTHGEDILSAAAEWRRITRSRDETIAKSERKRDRTIDGEENKRRDRFVCATGPVFVQVPKSDTVLAEYFKGPGILLPTTASGTYRCHLQLIYSIGLNISM